MEQEKPNEGVGLGVLALQLQCMDSPAMEAARAFAMALAPKLFCV